MHVAARLLGFNRLSLGMGLIALLAFAATSQAQEAKSEAAKPAVQLPVGNLDTKDWLKYSTRPLDKGEIDRLVLAELQKVNVKPAARTTDEQFVRRAYLDLTGKLPIPMVIVEFLKDPSTDKRAKLIDKVLDSDDYARHWSHYWRTVVTTRATLDFRTLPIVAHYERWLYEQFKANKRWDSITRDILTAKGKVMYAERDTNGQAFFLASRRGADAVTEIAAETSRIFLGIQIQCAQCHDHPSDVWKREQFHEFAAYFGRYRGERPIREEMKFIGVEIVSLPFAEHKMAAKDDPKKTTNMTPRFLDGKSPPGAKVAQGGGGFGGFGKGKGFPGKGKGFPGKGGFGGLNDEARRKALAEQITSTDNPWFAAAFVNRMWGEFMGQSFYSPIDDLGPQKDAMMPDVLARVAGSFRGNGYDIKQVIRDITNSDTYQRQIRPGESADEHHLFATHNPVRMNGNSLWQSLTGTLGPIGGFGGFGKGKGPFIGKGGFGGLEQQFKNEFSYDPSTKAEEIEGSIAQALIFMNNPQINQKIKAGPNNVLGRILANYPDNNDAVRAVYLRTLARRPTDREAKRVREHIASVKNRAEAFEDILWALVNSTEYQMKR